MKWSWRLGRIAGIPIRVHATFLVLLVWVALAAGRQGAGAAVVTESVAFLLAVFVLVLLHETAHAVVARHYGIATRDITLLPIGGVAEIDHMPQEPRQEMLIALAGPALNLGIAVVLVALLALSGELSTALGPSASTADLWRWPAVAVRLLGINISLGVFNMLPALPLDGGRVLRALFTLRTGDHDTATLKAARIGRTFALLFSLAGLFLLESPILVFIGLFVWIAAAAEAKDARRAIGVAHVPLASLMVTDVQTLGSEDALARAAELSLHGFQREFPVFEHGSLVGMLSQRDLIRGLARWGGEGAVADAMRRDFPSATMDAAPQEAVRGLASSGGEALPILRDGSFVGLLTMDTVLEFLALQGALRPASSH